MLQISLSSSDSIALDLLRKEKCDTEIQIQGLARQHFHSYGGHSKARKQKMST